MFNDVPQTQDSQVIVFGFQRGRECVARGNIPEKRGTPKSKDSVYSALSSESLE